VRDELAASYELRPGIIAANQLLTDIARAKPADMAALQAVPGLRKYQAQEFGLALLEVV